MTASIAIVGMDVKFAQANSIDSFDASIYNAQTAFAGDSQAALLAEQKSEQEWQQLLLATAAQQLKISSDELDLVLLKQADLSEAEAGPLRQQVANFYQAHSLTQALDIVSNKVHDKQRVVALIAVDLIDRQQLSQLSEAPEQHALLINEGMQAYQRGEGAAMLLCKAGDAAMAHGDKIYAFIDAVAPAQTNQDAAQQALAQADVELGEIGYLELSSQADSAVDEANAMAEVYPKTGELSCALGCVKTVIGESSEFAQLAAMIKASLALYQRYIPGCNDWQQAKADVNLAQSAFYLPAQSRTWYLEPEQKKRYAAINVIESNTSAQTQHLHLILSENDEDKQRQNGFLAQVAMQFLPFKADSQSDLMTQLQAVHNLIGGLDEQPQSLKDFAWQTYQNYQNNGTGRYTLVILADDKRDALKEIELAQASIASAFENQGEWKTPKGSYFTASPVGDEAGVAFVYPGVGAAYVGLGQDLFHLFPQAFNATDAMARNIGNMLKDKVISPRSQSKLSFKENKALDLELRRSLVTISECGVGYAYVFTKIFQQIFALKADFAMGYSMGEVSMYTAMDCWQDPGALSARLAASPTFNYGLSGEMRTLRKHWGVAPADRDQGKKLWETYSLKGTVEDVTAACSDEDKAYVTIVNTPDSLVLGGDPEACERVIAKLGVRGMAMEIPSAIHSAPAFKEYENMEKLYTLETAEKVDTKLYSSSCYLPIPQRTKSIANSIAKCFCEQVDFPRLVNTVHGAGAQIFMEMGAGRSCCSWIDKTLKTNEDAKPHVSIPVNAKGTPDHITISRCLAKLLSHGVSLDLTALYKGSMIEA